MLKYAIYFGTALFLFHSIIKAQGINGTVQDAILGDSIEGATVTIVEVDKSIKTGSNGAYSIDLKEPGNYTIRVEAPGYLRLSKRIIVKSDKDVGTSNLELDLKLYNITSNADSSKGTMITKYYFPGHGTVTIVIYDADGKKVRRAFDRSRRGGMRSFAWDGKDDRGQYVKPGRYTCRVSRGTMVMNRQLVWKGPGTE